MSQSLEIHPDRMDERQIIAHTHELLAEFGVEGWNVVMNARLTQTYGRCNYTARKIEISTKLAKINSADRTEDTIRHEIAHVLAGPGTGHGPAWKRACGVTGAPPRACFSSSNTNTIVTKRQKVSVQGICEPCGGIVIAVRKQMPKSEGWRHSPSKCRMVGGSPVTWVRIAG